MRDAFDDIERFQTSLDILQQQTNFPGATAAFILADGQCMEFATGYADQQNQIAMTSDMRMLSFTKANFRFCCHFLTPLIGVLVVCPQRCKI